MRQSRQRNSVDSISTTYMAMRPDPGRAHHDSRKHDIDDQFFLRGPGEERMGLVCFIRSLHRYASISFAAVDVTSIAVGSRSLTPSWARTSTDPNASIRLICIDNTTGAVTNANWWDDYTKTSATVSGLTPGDTYRFIVQTYNHLSQNGASSEQIFFDNAAVPHTVSGLWVGMPLTYATPNP